MIASGQSLPQINKSRPNLNKRVAFPMQASASSNTTAIKTAESGLPLPFSTAKYNPNASPIPPQGIPPPTSTSIVPPPISTLPPSIGALKTAQGDQPTVAQSESTEVPLNAQEFCQNVFAQFVKSPPEPHDAIKMGEIEKRLDILYRMWSTGLFAKEIEKRLYLIAKGIIDLSK